jgi:hypothetical protein
MAFESLEYRADDHSAPMPVQIAHNPSLTAREKLDLLTRLKAEVTGALENSEDPGLSPGEIDQAIDEVKLDVENGISEEAIMRGDN